RGGRQGGGSSRRSSQPVSRIGAVTIEGSPTMSGPVVISGILVQPLVREGPPGWRNGRRGALKMRCPRGRAGSSPAPGTSSTDTTAPAGFTAAGAVVEVRVSALGAGRDAVGLDACGLSAVEVTDPVHAQRVR